MKITTIIDKPDGSYEFKANLTDSQHRFLLEYAIRDLVTKGFSLFNVDEKSEVVTIMNLDNKDLPQ